MADEPPADRNLATEQSAAALRVACKEIVRLRARLNSIKDDLRAVDISFDEDVGLRFRAAFAVARIADGNPAEWDVAMLSNWGTDDGSA